MKSAAFWNVNKNTASHYRRKDRVWLYGLYWHSELSGKGKYYHYDKWKACKERGIQLIQVWEDDWNRNLVKRMLTHKLGVYVGSRLYARHTVVKVLTPR